MKKKAKKPVSRNKIRNGERVRLKVIVDDLRKSRSDLKDKIRQQTDELAKAYMSRDLERYMSLISKGYHRYPEGWLRLRRVISNDFKSRNNIVLRLTVNQVFDLEGAIMADIRWRLTYAGLSKPEEGYVEIQFDPADQLKILVQEKDRYFGSPSP